MSRKHNRHPNVKPASTIHPSLEPSNIRRQNGNLGRSASDVPSVNELIQHLRQTQITPSNDGRLNASRSVSQRTLHPSLRIILDIPETPPPRPRANARLLGGRPFRRTPGPPPPSSWLQLQSNSGNAANARNGVSVGSDQVLYRLERLPGVIFPPKDSLQHVVMKSMATNWPWHLHYDNEFLTEIPTRLKIILMSYIALQLPISDTYSSGTTLDILFGSSETTSADESDRIIRLDLGSAIRNSFSVKSLTRRLLLPRHEGAPSSLKCDESVPASWDDDDNSIEERRESTPEIETRNLALYTSPTHRLRFPNLKYLSLAHPDPKAASWDALLNLLSHISTITHLSLAHWPRPTLTPNLINERIQHPTIQTLSFAAGGTDTYSIDENNWVEAVTILRRLSRMTYCLKWLDLEGCGKWFGALSWDGRTLLDEEPFQTLSSAWNGPWRDVESICLGPGWIPSPAIDVDVSSDSDSFVPLVASMHAAVRSARHEQTTRSDDDLRSILTEQDLRDAEIARDKQRRVNEWKAYVETVRKAHEVEKHVHRIRREGAGKWVQFSFGGTGLDEKQALEKALAMIK